MPTLHELQSAFARSIVELNTDNSEVLAHLLATPRLSAANSLNVYRTNVFTNYTAALRDTYPVIERLVGAEFFQQAAQDFVQITPSTSGDMHDYGENFGLFLSTYLGARELPYLPDVARLEWVQSRVFHGPEAQALDLARLAEVTDEQQTDLCFTLHPASGLVQSRWPILSIWRANQPDATGNETVDLNAGAERVLVIRRKTEMELQVVLERLSIPEYAVLQALQGGATLGEALEATPESEEDNAFDFGGFFQRAILHGTLVDFELHTKQNNSLGNN